MKAFISSLQFDRDLVQEIKSAQVSKEVLYNSLLDGKITLQEYLAATR